jgi:antitoxin HigA-1
MAMAQLAKVHLGEVLKEEFLLPMGISQYRLAKEIGGTEFRMSAICQGKRAVGADTAARLARFFGATAAFLLGLQADYDTEEVERNLSAELEKIQPWKLTA